MTTDQNIFDPTGLWIMMPRGSRFLGWAAPTDQTVNVEWHTIVFPSGGVARADHVGYQADGAALQPKTNRHFLRNLSA